MQASCAAASDAAVNVRIFPVHREYDCIYVYSVLGIRKFRSANHLAVSHHRNLLLRPTIILHTRSEWLSLTRYYLADCFAAMCFGSLAKYSMKGPGHRILWRKCQFVYKLGYSHFTYKLLSPYIKHGHKRHKKKTFFSMRGIDVTTLRNAMFTIQTHRLPNCYNKNGIFARDIAVDSKECKKGFTL